MSHPLNPRHAPQTPRQFTQTRPQRDELALRLQQQRADDFAARRGGRDKIRDVVMSGPLLCQTLYSIPPPVYSSINVWSSGFGFISSDASRTVWIGYVSGGGDISIDSPTINNYSGAAPVIGDLIGVNLFTTAFPIGTLVIGYDAGLQTVTLSNNAAVTVAGAALYFTGQTHPFPSPANGAWQWGLNLFPFYQLTNGIPGGAVSSTIQLLDTDATVLTTSAFVGAVGSSGGDPVTYASLVNGTDSVPMFYGIRFTRSGPDLSIRSSIGILDPAIGVA